MQITFNPNASFYNQNGQKLNFKGNVNIQKISSSLADADNYLKDVLRNKVEKTPENIMDTIEAIKNATKQCNKFVAEKLRKALIKLAVGDENQAALQKVSTNTLRGLDDIPKVLDKDGRILIDELHDAEISDYLARAATLGNLKKDDTNIGLIKSIISKAEGIENIEVKAYMQQILKKWDVKD